MEKKCSFPIEFDINIKHLFILINTFCSYIIYEYPKLDNFYTFVLSKILSIIISIIFFIITKPDIKENENKKFFQSKKKEENNKFIKYKYIIDILIIIFNQLFLEVVSFLIFYNDGNILLIFQSFSIYAMIVFEHFVYKGKVYIHHFISLVSLFYFSTYHRSFRKNLIYGQKFTSFIYYFSEGFILFITKYIMDVRFVNPYLVNVIKTSLSICLFITKLILQTFFFQEKNRYYYFNENYFKLYKGDYFIQILLLISHTIFPIFNNLIIYYFTPYHYVIANEIGGLFNINNITFFIGCSISIFIFCEIIIINLCGMSYNTRKKIKERSQVNLEEIKTIELSNNLNESTYSEK